MGLLLDVFLHLDQVRDGRAPDVYQKPERFFERTFLTANLTALAGEVLRRLSGEKTEASPVFNMTTQFGGGKTHALTLLYHLANSGPAASNCFGVPKLLERAAITTVPKAACSVMLAALSPWMLGAVLSWTISICSESSVAVIS